MPEFLIFFPTMKNRLTSIRLLHLLLRLKHIRRHRLRHPRRSIPTRTGIRIFQLFLFFPWLIPLLFLLLFDYYTQLIVGKVGLCCLGGVLELLFVAEEFVLGGGCYHDFGTFDLLCLGEELLRVGDSCACHF